MNKEEKDIKFIKKALEFAKKGEKYNEIPIGAIIVKDDEIIAITHNRKEEKNDATAHAEIECIKNASKALNRWRLNDCTIYITLEPCFMCMAAIMEARIKRLVFGAYDLKRGAAVSKYDFSKINKFHKIEIKGGVLEKECREEIQFFFKKLRGK